MSKILQSPLTLPCGVVISNRIVKAAMTEGLAGADGRPTERLSNLYRVWSKGGSGMKLSGNIVIDKNHLERPGNVVIEGVADEALRARLSEWTEAAKSNSTHFWAQISHAGRQTQKIVNRTPSAPSDVKLGLPGGQFGRPRSLTINEIEQLAQRFANTALICKETGFTGVQIHAAHGYLLSSFLSPLANKRNDQYGGNLANRARFLLDVVQQTRALVGAEFPISVKMNSADFQRGGFVFEDSLQVAKWLEDAGIDLLEVSGGNYEQPSLIGVEGIEKVAPQNVALSTLAREAYFLDFVVAMRKEIGIPLMVTGGLRSCTSMEEIIASDAADMIGLARPFCTIPDAAKQLFSGRDKLPTPESSLRLFPSWLSFLRKFQMFKTIDTFAVQYWFYGQIESIADNGQIDEALRPLRSVLRIEKNNKQFLRDRKKLMQHG